MLEKHYHGGHLISSQIFKYSQSSIYKWITTCKASSGQYQNKYLSRSYIYLGSLVIWCTSCFHGLLILAGSPVVKTCFLCPCLAYWYLLCSFPLLILVLQGFRRKILFVPKQAWGALIWIQARADTSLPVFYTLGVWSNWHCHQLC